MVKNDCKVILQGDGGDELFAGYPRYHILSKFNQYKFIFNTLNTLKKIVPSNYIKQKAESVGFSPLYD